MLDLARFKGLKLSEIDILEAADTNAAAALDEDMRSGDITAALIPAEQTIKATVITREPMVMCGTPWVEAVFCAIDKRNNTISTITWHVNDGDYVNANAPLFSVAGNARSLLTAERSALNLLQTLSATATCANQYAKALAGHGITVLDTRKTLPGLRIAQKYAVAVGGCDNHRLGLWDAFLIKENHIAACGGITAAIKAAREFAADKPVQIEVENHAELDEALKATADIIMLDNFSRSDLEAILSQPQTDSVFEVSGNVELDNFTPLKSSQPYRVSIGALTKHVKAIDLSFRVVG